MNHKKIKNILLAGKIAKKNRHALGDAIRGITDSAVEYFNRKEYSEAETILALMIAEIIKNAKDPVLTGWDKYIPVVKREFNNKKYKHLFMFINKDKLINCFKECEGKDIVDSIAKRQKDLQEVNSWHGPPYNL